MCCSCAVRKEQKEDPKNTAVLTFIISTSAASINTFYNCTPKQLKEN